MDLFRIFHRFRFLSQLREGIYRKTKLDIRPITIKTTQPTSLLLVFLALFTVIFSPLSAQSIEELIARSDSAFAAFNDRSVLETLTQAYALDSSNYEVLWKLSRAHIDVAEPLEDKDIRKAHFEHAHFYAERAVAVDSLGSRGHRQLAVALGRIALDAGPKERVRLSKVIRDEVTVALALDSTDDVAWHVLGRWHRKVATLGWMEKKFANLFLGGVPKDASLETAIECFRQALAIRPNSIPHYLELGFTHEKLKENEQAIQAYEKLLEFEDGTSDDAQHKQTAKARLAELRS